LVLIIPPVVHRIGDEVGACSRRRNELGRLGNRPIDKSDEFGTPHIREELRAPQHVVCLAKANGDSMVDRNGGGGGRRAGRHW
jgi:hypothetical protein